MAEDLTNRFRPYLHKHLYLRLLELLKDREPYPIDVILTMKLTVLRETNLVEKTKEVYKSLYHGMEFPQEIWQKEVTVEATTASLKEPLKSIITFLKKKDQNDHFEDGEPWSRERLYRQITQCNDPSKFVYLEEMYKEMCNFPKRCKKFSKKYHEEVPAKLEELLQYCKYLFDCGAYSKALDYLYHYRFFSPNLFEDGVWYLFAAEILLERWDSAFMTLIDYASEIDSQDIVDSPSHLQIALKLMHWSPFVLFGNDILKGDIIHIFFKDRFLLAIMRYAPYLLRYVVAAVIIDKKSRYLLKKLANIIQQKQFRNEDPIVEYVKCLYVEYDFEAAKKKLSGFETVRLKDPFLGHHAVGAYLTDNAMDFIVETYCIKHQCIAADIIAEVFNMDYHHAQSVILDLDVFEQIIKMEQLAIN